MIPAGVTTEPGLVIPASSRPTPPGELVDASLWAGLRSARRGQWRRHPESSGSQESCLVEEATDRSAGTRLRTPDGLDSGHTESVPLAVFRLQLGSDCSIIYGEAEDSCRGQCVMPKKAYRSGPERDDLLYQMPARTRGNDSIGWSSQRCGHRSDLARVNEEELAIAEVIVGSGLAASVQRPELRAKESVEDSEEANPESIRGVRPEVPPFVFPVQRRRRNAHEQDVNRVGRVRNLTNSERIRDETAVSRDAVPACRDACLCGPPRYPRSSRAQELGRGHDQSIAEAP